MPEKQSREPAERRRNLRQELLSLPLRAKVRLPWRLLRDPQVPPVAKLLIPLGAAYLALPFDLIPDFIPVLGQLDDLLLLTLGLGLFLRLCPDETLWRQVEQLRAEASRSGRRR